MAKITAEEREAKARIARIRLIRSFALTNVINYHNAEALCDLNGYRKMDVGECCKYYLAIKWMSGEVLRDSSYGRNSCRLDEFRQCAIIAHCPEDEMDIILEQAKKTEVNIGWRSYYKEKSNPYFLLLTRALNAYCHCHPETLGLFTDMDDIPVYVPLVNDQILARERWDTLLPQLIVEPFADLYVGHLSVLLTCPEFYDFFKSLHPAILNHLVWERVSRYESFHRMSETDYNYLCGLTQTAKVSAWQASYDYIYDTLLFYQHFLFEGGIDQHLALLHFGTKPYALLSAIKCLMNNNANEAVKILEKDMKQNKASLFSDTYANFVYLTALQKADTPAALKKAETLLKKKEVKDSPQIYIKLMLQMKAHPDTNFKDWVNICGLGRPNSLMSHAIYILVAVSHGWSDYLVSTGETYAKTIYDCGMQVLALDFAQVFDIIKDELPRLEEATGMHALQDKVVAKKPWEELLETMIKKYASESSTSAKGKPAAQEVGRVIYHVDTRYWSVQPRLQKSKDGGATWSTGRNIALKTFYKGIPEMTTIDQAVASHVRTISYGWYGGTDVVLEGTEVIAALVGSPVVFDAQNPDIKIEIQEEKLQVQVKETAKGYTVSYNVEADLGTYHTINVTKENAQMLKVVRLSKSEIELLHLFDRIKVFPPEAKDMLTKLLAGLGKKVTVMSPLLKGAENVKQQKGDSSLTVQIVPYGDVFTARTFVKPLITTPPYCTPGQGLEYLSTNVKGEAVQITRNLKAEKKNQKELLTWMEPFAEYETDEGWQLPIEECLSVLDLLREHTDKCRIEWPEGVRFRVSRPMIGADQLRLSVKGVGHWFEVDGDVAIDDKTNLKVSELLKRVRDAKGNFIQVGDDEYIAISKQLKKQLAELDRVLQPEKKSLKLSEFNSQFLHDMEMAGVSLDSDANYTGLLTRMDEADKLKIRVPKTLQADLRDYQMDGYRWLSRLAHWGAGACLADDMGLGKTVQTIALLLSRSSEGASLVVMPTSVLLNWYIEIQRFAPTLNIIVLRNAQDRKEAIKKAGKGDVVLATYGLLVTEEEILVEKKWNVIVLDEAHTIKNKETKMSKVSMQLDGKFRLLLTGTPLQNHLSEIWNLFQFATPGLLTGFKQFTQEFINPIERDNEKEPQRQLKRILSPFILRRTKNEVLNELPEKTEITLKVELSDLERALYNQLREEAVLALEEGGNNSAVQALAQITKLRQTACNAGLVLPAKEAKKIPSSKCEAFLKLVDELIQNHHRALVFSQFTSHLALIEKELKQRGIEYQYLDGAVSPTERIRRVDDFQKGEQPLFLISLKAGGTGLNLTSADYVIHLDPWWNPSIEDQASDRAYRIGQDKPVTVYRLIASDTIEEKIIALHQTKKSLADALLEGSDMAHKLSKDEILALIKS